MSKRKTHSYRLTPETIKTIDRLSEESDHTKSRIVELAIREYADNDRLARVERKVDQLLDQQDSEGGTPSEKSLTKRERELQSNDMGVVADALYDILCEKIGESEMCPEPWLSDVIDDNTSGSKYYHEEYRPLLEQRLGDDGWLKNPVANNWVRGDEKLEEQLTKYWSGVQNVVKDPDSEPDYLLSKMEPFFDDQSTIDEFLDREIVDGEEAGEILEAGLRQYKRYS